MEKLIHYNSGSSRLFLEVPHSGQKGIESLEGVPAALAQRLRTSEAVRASLVFGCDLAVPPMTQFEARRSDPTVTTLSNDLSRIFTDANRDKNTDVSGRICEGFNPDAFPNGVVWARTVPRGLNFDQSPDEIAAAARSQFEDIFNAPLSPEEFAALMGEVYDPYHARIQQAHREIRAEHGEVVHLSLHTFPPVLGTAVDGGYCLGKPAEPGPFNMKEGTFPDLLLIHNNFKAASREKVEVVRRHFEKAGLIVQDGFGPFLGSNGVTGIYGDPDNGVHVIGIEHIPHRIETGRHLGSMAFDEDEAKKHQEMYSGLFEELAR
jgi:N-formylglutamate amidohydrolase